MIVLLVWYKVFIVELFVYSGTLCSINDIKVQDWSIFVSKYLLVLMVIISWRPRCDIPCMVRKLKRLVVDKDACVGCLFSQQRRHLFGTHVVGWMLYKRWYSFKISILRTNARQHYNTCNHSQVLSGSWRRQFTIWLLSWLICGYVMYGEFYFCSPIW